MREGSIPSGSTKILGGGGGDGGGVDAVTAQLTGVPYFPVNQGPVTDWSMCGVCNLWLRCHSNGSGFDSRPGLQFAMLFATGLRAHRHRFPVHYLAMAPHLAVAAFRAIS